MFNKITNLLQLILPKQGLTIVAGWIANQKAGWLTQLAIKVFIKIYKVNMQEAEFTSPEHYQTFNQFFTRKLKADARPIVSGHDQLAMPVDGKVSQSGSIEHQQIVQAKNHNYTLDALLACDQTMVETFTNGLFITTYLSPRDYHRIHMPCDGVLREMLYVPGTLFSVSPNTVETIPNLFARNERVICLFDTPIGPMAQILVGATIVGSMVTRWSGIVMPSRKGIIQHWNYPTTGENAIKLKKGEEMGYFQLGSTVINLFTSKSVILSQHCYPNTKVKMGELLAISPNSEQANNN